MPLWPWSDPAADIGGITAVDFSPAPQVGELLEHETTLAEIVASLRLIPPDLQLLESEPAVRVLKIVACRELHMRHPISQAVFAVMPAYALGMISTI